MKEPDWQKVIPEELWKYVAWHLESAGIESVLVGGAVVAIYTEGLYQSKDLDMVPEGFDRDRLEEVLEGLGFQRSGRHYAHPDCEALILEFPPGPVSLGEEFPIEPDEVEWEGQTLKILSPTDCVKDRLASFIHWKVRDTFDQAVLVCRRQKDRVDLGEVNAWCCREGSPETFERLERSLAAATDRRE